jgi:hypothetical protein
MEPERIERLKVIPIRTLLRELRLPRRARIA